MWENFLLSLTFQIKILGK